jgi:hypothetical protein
MPEIRMNSLKSLAMNCRPLSEIILGRASGASFPKGRNDPYIKVRDGPVPKGNDAVEKVIGAGSLQIRRKNDAIRSPISDR